MPQRGYFDAQIGLNNAVRDELLSVVNLYKALGGDGNKTSPPQFSQLILNLVTVDFRILNSLFGKLPVSHRKLP